MTQTKKPEIKLTSTHPNYYGEHFWFVSNDERYIWGIGASEDDAVRMIKQGLLDIEIKADSAEEMVARIKRKG